MNESPVPAPPEVFNFARHLLEANAGPPGKAAFIDDAGVAHLWRARRAGQPLRRRTCSDAGVKREERVLLLMQDGNDWPVAFLGALLRGVVPVAVNTLLTADDYAYMLEHSRAQAAFVSGAVQAGAESRADQVRPRGSQGHRVAPRSAAGIRRGGFEAFLDRNAPLSRAAPHQRRRPRLLALFVGLDRAAPKAPCIRTPIPTGRSSSTARRARPERETTSASRPPSCSSPTGWATR